MNRNYPLLLFFLSLIIFFSSCNKVKYKGEIKLARQEDFDTIIDNKKIQLFTLQNSSGCVAQFTNFGARWIAMRVPDKSGQMIDVVLGFNKLKDYLSAGERFLGATIGCYGNRIAKGRFNLNGIDYELPINNQSNSLHGLVNFREKLISYEKYKKGRVKFCFLKNRIIFVSNNGSKK